MIPNLTKDRSALRWIRGELDETVGLARRNLEEYLEGAGEDSQLQDCVRYLHQIHGTLQLAQVHGGAMLADEMEQVARALAEGNLARKQEAAETLVLGMVQLPVYLQKVESGQPDIPLVLMPLLNDLRAARDASLVSEISLFAPHLDDQIAADQVVPGSGNPELVGLARRGRSVYHRGLLMWFKGVSPPSGLHHIRDMLAELEGQAGTAPVRRMLESARALSIALADGSVEAGVAVKLLYGRLDRQFLKTLIEKGEEAAARALPVELLKNFLFYVARSDSEDPVIQSVQQAGALANSFPDMEQVGTGSAMIAGPDQDLFDAVSENLREDLRAIKDDLDLYIRGDRADIARLANLAGPIQKVGDTLGMVGRGELRSRLRHACELIQSAESSGSQPSEDDLMEIAGTILHVESSVEGLQPVDGGAEDGALLSRGEMRVHIEAVVGEAFVELAKVKDYITDFLEQPDDAGLLADVPARFAQVVGAMRILGQSDAANLLAGVAPFLARVAAGERELPDAVQRDALADLITSIEYYLESSIDEPVPQSEILDYARDAAHRLGIRDDDPVGAESAPSVEAVPADSETSSDTSVVDEALELSVAEETDDEVGSEVAEDSAGSPLSAVPDSTPAASADVPTASADKPPLEDIDDEILEIFIEEAREEIGVIQERYPQWRSNQADQDAMTTFRRSFHTLKGSGRLVGAATIGEFAWSIENLLNRIIDDTVQVTPEVLDTLDAAVECLPALLEAQEKGVPPQVDVSPLEERAHALAHPRAHGAASREAATATSGENAAAAGEEEEEPAPAAQAGESDSEQDPKTDSGATASVAESPDPVAASEEPPAEAAAADGGPSLTDEIVASEVDETPVAEAASAPNEIADEIVAPEVEETPLGETASTPIEMPDEGPVPADPGNADTEPAGGVAPIELEPELYEIFYAESLGHIAVISEFIERSERSGNCAFDDEVRRAYHTLRGSAHAAQVAPVTELAAAYERLADVACQPGNNHHDVDVSLLRDGHDALFDMIEAINVEAAELPDWESLLAAVNTERERLLAQNRARESVAADGPDSEAPDTSELIGADSDSADASELITADSDSADTSELIAADSEASDSSELITADSEASDTSDLVTAESGAGTDNEVPDTAEPVLGMGMASVALDQRPDDQFAPVVDAEPEPEPEPAASQPGPTPAESAPDVKAESTPDAVSELADEPAATPPPQTCDDLDPELAEIFLEEARELIEAMEQEFGQWQQSAGDKEPVAALQRTLHTLKGGARMAGVTPIGDLSHAMETLFERVVSGSVENSPELQRVARRAVDRVASEVDNLESGRPVLDTSAVVNRLEAAARGEFPQPGADAESELADPVSQSVESILAPDEATGESPAAESRLQGDGLLEDSQLLADSQLLSDSQLLADSTLLTDSELLEDSMLTHSELTAGGTNDGRHGSVVQFPEVGSKGDAKAGAGEEPGSAVERRRRRRTEEKVRVSSTLLDALVNHAGEVSIFRARLEQQNTSLDFNLDELGQTTTRLREQLRHLEIETENQILSRFEREADNKDLDFDPLEMDRYSTIQQLSRALSETVNDLTSIGEAMHDLNRDSDTLLLQQSRVTTDLQDGLMRTRMVPFESQATRLKRVVRQTADSLSKKADLEVRGGSRNLDRGILERILGPLEHLLRNAVAHGIESPAARLEAGKDETGAIKLSVTREGSDVVLAIVDDGAGMNRERIRQRAVERGLLDSGAEIDDRDLYQFILEPGFSTADQVSQISGRGVGMDAVLNEVKQLGGSLEIDSQVNKGSKFIIRLPFTLAITEALMVNLGEDIFAVPHSSIEGVIRVPRDDLIETYEGKRESLEYAGYEYQLRYLGMLLAVGTPNLPETQKWFPVMLVRAGEHRVAVQVDSLLGNRQIVVKSVGAQLSSVRWFTGGTIMADGRVSLILDINSLVRMDTAHHVYQIEEEPEAVQGVTVMVVDDSITVRKVTSRLLERHNMRVLTATDGVDAIAKLQENRPDIMLLDIEMPRMDGFELARHMRNSEDYQHVPIVMITSRTGDKHRNRALEIGVKRYLGKPYQEAELLENIYAVLAEETT